MTTRGPRRLPPTPAVSQRYLALDVGGTKVAAGVVNGCGEVLSRVREATATAREPPGILAGLIRLGKLALAAGGVGGPPTAVGLVLPGPVDPAGPTQLLAPTIPELAGVPLGPPLSVEFGAPVAGENDANACALAEARFGAARGARLMAYITVSTGVGGGIVYEGKLLRGAGGLAGEFGHQVLEPDGDPCDCGGFGCLESIASGPAIARRARRMLQAQPGSLLRDRSWRAERPFDASLIAAAAREGDALAAHLFEEVGELLGLGVANLVTMLDPDCVVMGGGVMAAADLLLPAVRQAVAKRAMPNLARNVRVLEAALGDDVALVGAATVAMGPSR